MKKIIVAPLNWGLGHASRCVPIIRSLKTNKYTPVIAGDGDALRFLQKEFPELESIQLPSYNISYAKNLKRHLLFKVPKILKAVIAERKVVEQYINEHNDVVGVISDNRFGVRSVNVPSIYITHQVNVLSGFWTPLTSFVHQKIIQRFDECWIPDDSACSLSGKLSRSKRKLCKKHIGILSRFSKQKKKATYDLAVILSGPEPLRTQLENTLLTALKEYKGTTVFVRGIMESAPKKSTQKNISIHNYMLSEELQEVLHTSEVVISRSGYSSVMDYAATGKKGILIPTKGQTEQEYLAHYLAKQGYVLSIEEKSFDIKYIEEAKNLKGLPPNKTGLDKELFSLFERK